MAVDDDDIFPAIEIDIDECGSPADVFLSDRGDSSNSRAMVEEDLVGAAFISIEPRSCFRKTQSRRLAARSGSPASTPMLLLGSPRSSRARR
jgi:hypothetical protein